MEKRYCANFPRIEIALIFVLFFAAAGSVIAADKFTPKLRGGGLSFTPNKGQVVDKSGKLRPDILYKGSVGAADIYLRKSGVSYVFSNRAEIEREVYLLEEDLKSQGKANEVRARKDELLNHRDIKIHRVDMDFVNRLSGQPAGVEANQTVAEDEQEGYQNFYYPQCPKGITNIKQYNKVSCKNIYEKIDVVYFGTQEQGLKYNIVVQPHGDPSQIKVQWTGAQSVSINSNGELVVATSVNTFQESIPKVYQEIEGRIVEVRAEYKLQALPNPPGGRANSSPTGRQGGAYLVSFNIGTYNPEYALIIDPWATYYGGSNTEGSKGIATDLAGNVFITGGTASVDFPVSPGAFQTSFAGGSINYGSGDAFVVKFDAAGNRLWSTYYGGSADDVGLGIATDNAGNVIITGYTNSLNLPVFASGYTQAFGGMVDAFVLKLNPAGAGIWATFYGGSDNEDSQVLNNNEMGLTCAGIATDNAGDIYFTGYTSSTNFPVQAGCQMNNAGGWDAFIVKFNSGGSRLWATYYGGSGNENYSGENSIIPLGIGFADITVDHIGNVIITGGTSSVDFPVLSGCQMASGGPSLAPTDGYVAKFTPAGIPIWSTYYGGSSMDYGSAVITDNADNVIVAGFTYSTDFPVLNAYQAAFGGGVPFGDAFVTKFTPAGKPLWSTYFGTSAEEYALDVATDVHNNVFILMEAEDVAMGNLIDNCSYQPVFGGVEDVTLVKFTPLGQKVCSTYLGGAGEDDLDNGGGISIYGNSLYVTGMTTGSFPVSTGAFQTTFGGNSWDAFVASLCTNICEGNSLGIGFSADKTTVCANSLVNFTPAISSSCDTAGYTYLWTFTGGIPATSTALKPAVIYPTAGTYPVKLVVTTTCKKDSLTQASYISVNTCTCAMSAATAITSAVSCSGASDGKATITISSGSGGPYTYNWSNGLSGTTSATSIQVTGLGTQSYTVTVTEGTCASIATFTVSPGNTLAINSITAGAGNTCYGGKNGSATAIISSSAAGPYTYSWSNGAGSVSSALSNSVNSLAAGTYTLTITDGSCSATSAVTITQPLAWANAISMQWSCISNKGSATCLSTNGNPPYSYVWSNGQTTTTATGLSLGSVYTVTVTDKLGCTTSDAVTITTPPAILTLAATDNSCNTPGSVSVTGTWGTAPYSYSWNNGQTSSSIVGVAAGTYTVTVTDVNGCSETNAATVNGNPSVDASFTQSPSGTICIGTTVNFTNTGASGANISGDWSVNENPVVTGYTTDFSCTFLSAGTFSVTHTVTDNNIHCSDYVVSTVNVVNCSAPTVTATGSSICPGSCGTASSSGIGGTGTLSYSWSTGDLTQNISPCPLNTATYTVTVTDASSNTATSVATVVVYPAVTASTSSSGNLNCLITSTNLTASSTDPMATYQWGGGPATKGYAVSSAGTYTVTVADPSSGCTSTSAITVTSNTTPPVISSATGAGAISCSTGTASLNASSAGNTLVWNGGALSNASNPATVSAAGTYTVTATNPSNGCTSSSTVQVTLSTPNVTAGAGAILTCGATTAVLSVSSTTPGVTYSWSPAVVSGGTSNSATVNAAGNYTCTVTDPSDHCSNIGVVSVISSTTPPSLTASSNTNLSCIVSSVTLTGTSAGNTMVWNGGALTNAANPATVSAAGVYTVTATDIANSCSSTTTVVVTSNTTPPVVTAASSNNLSCSQTTTTLTGSSVGSTMVWNGPSLSGGINPASVGLAGTYTVTATSTNGCTSTAAVTITSSTAPPAVSAGSSNNISCITASTTLTGSSAGNTMVWNGPTLTNAPDPATTFTGGTYTVTATNSANGCTNTATVVVSSNTTAPIVTADSSGTITCTSSSVVLTGTSAGNTMVWNGPGTINAANPVTVSSAGTYTVTATNPANGCTGTISLTIHAATGVPQISIVTPAQLTCITSSVNLSGGSTTPGVTFQWTNPSGPGPGAAGNSVSAAGTYTLVVTDPGSGCTAHQSVTVVSNTTAPTVTAGSSGNLSCINLSSTLTGSSMTGGTANTMLWNGGSLSNATNPAVVNAPATYTVTATDGTNGCTNTATIVITSNTTQPTVTAVSSGNINCTNASSTLTGTSLTGGVPNAMIWNGPGLTNAPNPGTAGAAGTYTVTATDPGNGCTNTALVTITRNTTVPTVTAVSSGAITCTSASVILTGTSVTGGTPNAMVWNGPGTINAANPVTVTSAGTYTVTATDGSSGCSSTTTVTINAAVGVPNISVATPDTLTCVTTSTTLQGNSTTPAVTFQWTDPSGPGPVTSSNTIITAGSYTLVVTDPSNGCTAHQVVAVNSNTTAPAVTAASSGNLTCTVSSSTLTGTSVTGGKTNTMVWNGPGLTNASNPVTVNAAGSYTVTATDPANGCTSTTSINITAAIGVPNISIATPAVLTCTTASVSLQGNSTTPGVTYQWIGGPLSSAETVSSTGIYTLIVTDPGNNCSATATVKVNSNTVAPIVTALSSDTLTCKTSSTSLIGTSAGNAMVWNGGTLSNAVNPATTKTAGTYTVTATDPGNGCTATALVTVISNTTAPIVTASNTGPINCNKASVNLLGTSVSGGVPYAMTWNGPGLTNAANPGTVAAAGTYTVTATNAANGCTATTTTTVTSTPVPTLKADTSKRTCVGKSQGSLLAISTGTGSLTYSWSNGSLSGSSVGLAGSQTLTNLSSGIYTVTVTDVNGCTATASASVGTYPSPLLSVVPIGGDTTIHSGVSVQLSVSVSKDAGKPSYAWTPANSLSNPTIYNPLADPSRTTTYTVLVTDANSCSASDSILVNVIEPIPCDSDVIARSVYIPSAFSPNGDGQNDVLYMRIAEIPCVQRITLKIFDRWGEPVFSTSNPNFGWDGTLRGESMKQAVFVYYLNVTLSDATEVSRKGTITLLK